MTITKTFGTTMPGTSQQILDLYQFLEFFLSWSGNRINWTAVTPDGVIGDATCTKWPSVNHWKRWRLRSPKEQGWRY